MNEEQPPNAWPLFIASIPRPSELEWMSAAVANEEGMEATTPTSEGREERGTTDRE